MLELSIPSFLVILTAEGCFWWFFIIAIACYVGFCALAEERPWIAIIIASI